MKSSVLVLVLLASSAWAQRAGYSPSIGPQQPASPTPSPQLEVARTQSDKRTLPPPQQASRIDVARLRQDADELASLAQSIPPDVDQTTKGILPKDLDKKLKRIEKLSKQLRSRISP